MKRQKNTMSGITLIALVITIIVLLILAGVSVAMLTGENGTLNQANKAKAETEEAAAREELQLAFMASFGVDGEIDMEKLKDNFGKLGVDDIHEISSTPQNVVYKDYVYKLTDEGVSLTGEKVDPTKQTETSEDCFIWASNKPGEEGYGTIIGYTGNITNYPKVRIPSRCTRIELYADLTGYTDDITASQSRAFTNKIQELEIPGTVKVIGQTAFAEYDCFNVLRKVTIENGVEVIGEKAFLFRSSLQEVIMADSVKRIETEAFKYCTALYSFTLSKNVEYIGEAAFSDCYSLNNIVIWENIAKVERRAFHGWPDNRKINVEAGTVPDTWDSDWNDGCKAEIVYGYTGV